MPQSRRRILIRIILRVGVDVVGADVVLQVASALRSRAELAAENLFLRKQLALYLERQGKPHHADDATRITLVALSQTIEWRRSLTIVKPETLIGSHRKGFQLFWR
jgi:putative transposase